MPHDAARSLVELTATALPALCTGEAWEHRWSSEEDNEDAYEDDGDEDAADDSAQSGSDSAMSGSDSQESESESALAERRRNARHRRRRGGRARRRRDLDDYRAAAAAVGLTSKAASSAMRQICAAAALSRGRLVFARLNFIEEQRRAKLQREVTEAGLTYAFHAIIVIDIASRISLFSGAAETVFGLSAAAVDGLPVTELLLHSEDAATMRQALSLYQRTGGTDLLTTPRRVRAKTYFGHDERDRPGRASGSVHIQYYVEALQSSSIPARDTLVMFAETVADLQS